ncbi:hypothetical protein PF011_g11077 [Phytophthora fragariae]|uniref:RxLR effector protein n=1 Tax=Phytophthora fragariae TaxID=53985 RepID=A0A6A3KJH6_9STRA|nr:hypothetical protein PF011_g11077 [Phytophthora fragariae]
MRPIRCRALRSALLSVGVACCRGFGGLGGGGGRQLLDVPLLLLSVIPSAPRLGPSWW